MSSETIERDTVDESEDEGAALFERLAENVEDEDLARACELVAQSFRRSSIS